MPTGDNREIYDSADVQRLAADDINRLKEEGVKGEVCLSVTSYPVLGVC